jgi:hypothetical protein
VTQVQPGAMNVLTVGPLCHEALVEAVRAAR